MKKANAAASSEAAGLVKAVKVAVADEADAEAKVVDPDRVAVQAALAVLVAAKVVKAARADEVSVDLAVKVAVVEVKVVV